MNLQQIRDAVRLQLDLPEEDDLPTGLLDLYIDEGVDQTLNFESRWPFFEAAWAVAAVEGDLFTPLPPDVRSIVSVVDGDGNGLHRIGHQFAERNFSAETGVPALYSAWGRALYVWPRVEETSEFVIRGYRAPASMAGVASAEPDMDERLHSCLWHYACSRVYAQQEDEVLANYYLQTWSAMVSSARVAIMRPEYQGLWTMGGGGRAYKAARRSLY